MSATPAPAAAATEESKQIFRLNLLETIKVAQMQHGIRHDDYNRYRQYCARKLRRLRMGLDFKHGRKEFKRKVIEPKMVVDLRFLMIPLFNAERAWSYAMALKQEFSEENPRPRFHLYRRLAKAVRHAQELSKLCTATADPRSQLEAEAYAAWMQGSYMLEREQWGPSQASFNHALNVFSKLAKIGDAENQALCEERVAAIQPSLRYCEYMSKRTGGSSSDDSRALQEIQKGLDEALQAKLEHIINESRKTQQETMAHVEWQGQKVSVKEGKVRLQLLEAQDLERSLTEAKSDKDGSDEVQRKLEVYSKLLACFDEALQALRDDLREAEKGAKGGASKVTAQSLMQLRDYITFRKLSANNDRNLLMAEDWANTFAAQEAGERPKGKKVKADDIVHLFEKMVQNCNEVLAVGNSAADAKIKQDTDSQIAAYVCLRCFYLAESYRVVPKYAEAYALYGRAKELSQSALQQRQAAAPKDARLLNWLKTVQTDSEIRKHVVHATAVLEREDGVSKIQEGLAKAKLDDEKKDERTLLERLDSFEAGTASSQFQLVHVPPNYVTVPCKPILFDLAFNFAEFVPIDKRAVAPAPKPAPAPKQPAQQPKQQQQQQKQKGGATPAPTPAPAPAAPAPAPAPAAAAQAEKPAEKQGGGWFGFLRR